jgi:dTDP-4-dehydrorhamnose reductase
LAHATAGLLAGAESEGFERIRRHAGLYHLACRGAATRYEWARAIMDLDPAKREHTAVEVQPAASAEFPSRAARPKNSALDSSHFAEVFGVQLPEWQDALRLALMPESESRNGLPGAG